MSSSAFSTEPRSVSPVPPPPCGCHARIARCEAEVVATSPNEVRLQHVGPLKVGTEVSLSYEEESGRRVQMAAVVRSCRVLALGGGRGGATLYETCVSTRSENCAAGNGEEWT